MPKSNQEKSCEESCVSLGHLILKRCKKEYNEEKYTWTGSRHLFAFAVSPILKLGQQKIRANIFFSSNFHLNFPQFHLNFSQPQYKNFQWYLY